MKADCVVRGKIYTADKNHTIAEAFAISKGKIIYVGDLKNINQFMDETTKVIDYFDGLIIPGMTEGHAHISSSTELLFGANLDGATSVEEYQDIIENFADKHLNDEVITGNGFENGVFDEVGPTAKIIDEVVSDRPVVIVSSDHHSYWVNSKAMELVS